MNDEIKAGDRVKSIVSGFYLGAEGKVLSKALSYNGWRGSITLLKVQLDNGQEITINSKWVRKI